MATLEISEDLDERLAALAERFGVSKEEFASRALEEAFAELEVAVESYEDYLQNGKQSIPLEELEEKLGLEPLTDFDEETVH